MNSHEAECISACKLEYVSNAINEASQLGRLFFANEPFEYYR